MAHIEQNLPEIPGRDVQEVLSPEPTKDELSELVMQYRQQGLCGRRIAEENLVPFFIANPRYGQREIDLLDTVLTDVFEGSNLCVTTRKSECSRLRGGCKGEQ